MNSAELIVALHADANSALARDIRFIERHEPDYLLKVVHKLNKREYRKLIEQVFGKAGEIRATSNC